MGAAAGDTSEPWGQGSDASIEILEESSALGAETYAQTEVAEDAQQSWTPAPAPSPFELDRGFDPDWTAEAPAMESVPMEAMPMEAVIEPSRAPARALEELGSAPPMAGEVMLTDVAWGASLFTDPDLEVARLTLGGAREISVPVEVGEGGQLRRFVLTVRLTLSPAD
jgi:hypothetical protein